jgi:actinin alpha
MSEKGVMEKTWENIQKKTFTGWVNSHLRKRNLHVANIETDLEDGLKLIALLEIISDDVFNYKFEKKPKMRIQKVGNVGHCLQFIKSKGVNLAGIGAEEIVDGNLKMILGMIWTIILRFQIQDISMEDLSAKEGLLLWCQKKTQGYPGVNVKNFHMSFQDGLAFCALIHKHRPDLLDWDGLDKTNKALCLQTAFDVAEKHLDVPKLMDVSDLLDVAKPDERSVMTYVSLYYHVFASSQKAEAAGRRVGKVIDFAEANDKLKNDYLSRAQKLANWIQTTTNSLDERNFPNSLEGVVEQISELKGFKTNDKPPKYNEKVELDALSSGLNTKLAVNKRPPFNPPAGLSTQDLESLWQVLEKAEHNRDQALREELRRQKKIKDLLRKFNQLAGKLESWAGDRETSLTSSDLGDSVSAVLAKLKNLDAFESEFVAQTNRVGQLSNIGNQLAELGFNDMGYVNGRVSGINDRWTGLKGHSANRRGALQAHLEKLQQIENLLLDFAKRGLEFRVWLENADDSLTDPIVVDTVAGVDEFQHAFDDVVNQKGQKEGEYHSLQDLAQQCKANNVAENTYSEVSISQLQQLWASINNLIEERRSALAAELNRQQSNEALRVSFAQKANSFGDWIKSKNSAIEGLSGEIQAQLDSLSAIGSGLGEGKHQYDDCVALTHQLDSAQVSDNPHTTFTIEALKSQWEALNVLITKKRQVLEKELLAQSGSGLSASQIAEFKECFKHFDKDEDNLLSRLELGACLKSLGEEVGFEEGGKLDSILHGIDGDSDGKVTFEEFVGYMERVSSGSDTPDSIKQAFKVLAGDKDYVTEADLRSVLPAEKVTYCLAHMQPYPGVNGGFDYNSFTDKVLYC